MSNSFLAPRFTGSSTDERDDRAGGAGDVRNYHFEWARRPIRLLANAIEAMREPTKAMMEIAGTVEDYQDRDGIFGHSWRAMIDAALE